MQLSEKIGWTFVVFVAVFLLWLTVRMSTATGAVDVCRIESQVTGPPSQQFLLMGHRSWRADVTVGRFDSFDDATAAAQKIGCPLVEK